MELRKRLLGKGQNKGLGYETTKSVDRQIEDQDTLQQDLIQDMSKLVGSLKQGAVAFQSALDEDKQVLGAAEIGIQVASQGLMDVSGKLRKYDLGKRRKWLMKHCQGDVLEVSCGTGRNIKYLDMSRINSITFLDSSENMMEITHKKFREKFPKYKKVAFVVGKAENLVDLAEKGKPSLENEKENQVKYDTIVEAFGLCSHEDPVKALNNFGKLLKPDGRIILLEHGRGQYDFINKILDNRAERRLNTWGCRWNLDLGEVLDDSDLELVEEKRTHLGTTWCIVAKRKGDVKKKDELGFVEKYLQSSIRKRMESFEKKDDMASKKELEPVPPVSKS